MPRKPWLYNTEPENCQSTRPCSNDETISRLCSFKHLYVQKNRSHLQICEFTTILAAAKAILLLQSCCCFSLSASRLLLLQPLVLVHRVTSCKSLTSLQSGTLQLRQKFAAAALESFPRLPVTATDLMAPTLVNSRPGWQLYLSTLPWAGIASTLVNITISWIIHNCQHYISLGWQACLSTLQ